MQYNNDEIISAEEFFGTCEGDVPCGKKKVGKGRQSADADAAFLEMKIRVAMDARGISREEAEEMLGPYGNPGFIA